MNRRLFSAATLSGYSVRTRDLEDLGCIEELMISPRDGTIQYAVLSLVGFLGLAGKLIAVPWGVLKLEADQRVFILDVDIKTLENAPAFHEEDWPDFGDQWANAIQTHYGLQLEAA